MGIRSFAQNLLTPYTAALKTVTSRSEPYFLAWNGEGFQRVKTTDTAALAGAMFRRGTFQGFSNDDAGRAAAVAVCVWAFRCIYARMDELSQIPWAIVDRGGKPIDDHPVALAIRDVSRRQGTSLISLVEASLCIWGEVYLELMRSGRPYNRPAGLKWLNPIAIEPEVVEGEIQLFRYAGEQRFVEFSPDEIAYYKYFNPTDDARGLAPLTVALDSINADVSQRRYINAWFRNDAMPRAIITAKQGQVLTDSDIDRLRGEWDAQFKGVDKKFKVGFLTAALDFQKMQEEPDVAQTELKQAAREEICGAFGVPVSRAGAWDSPRYQMNPEATRAFYAGLIRPEAVKMQDMFNEQILPFFGASGGARFAFDFRQVDALIEDEKTRTDITDRMYTAGRITLNEARQRDGLLPVEGGDSYLIPLNMHFVTKAQLKAGDTAPPPPAVTVAKEPPKALPAGETAKAKAAAVETNSAFVYLDLAHDPAIEAAVKGVRAALGDVEGITWNEPTTWHITLVYCMDATDDHMAGVARSVSGAPVPVNSGRLGLFENQHGKVNERALHLVVEPSEELTRLQKSLYNQFRVRDLELSPYSTPGKYQPHITIAYLPPDIPMPDIGIGLTTTAKRVGFGRDEYQTYAAVELKATKQDSAADELRAWKRKVEGKGKPAPFETRYLDPATKHRIEEELSLCKGDRDAIKAVFNVALAELDFKPDAATALKAIQDARFSSHTLREVLDFLNQNGFEISPEVGLSYLTRDRDLAPLDALFETEPLLRLLDLARGAFDQQVQKAALRLARGEITAEDWEREMRELVLWLFAVAMFLAHGTVERIDLDSVRALEAAVAAQYTYLEGFARAVRENAPNALQIAARGHLYGLAADGYFWQAYATSAGLPMLPFYPRDLQTLCKMRCGCTYQIVKRDGEGNYDCYYRNHPALENCPTCLRRAAVANPLQIRNGTVQPIDLTGVYA